MDGRTATAPLMSQQSLGIVDDWFIDRRRLACAVLDRATLIARQNGREIFHKTRRPKWRGLTRLLVHSPGMTTTLDLTRRQSRRGEIEAPLANHARLKLEEIYRELTRLQSEAALLRNEFLAFLISSAGDEAHDQLRDDLILRNELKDEAERETTAA